MEEPKFGDPRVDSEEPAKPETGSFALERYAARNGFIYELHFATEAEAENAVRAFWDARGGGGLIARGLRSGMLHPFRDEITGGDRTSPRKAYSTDLRKHPDKPFIVQFNGNTEALSPKGEAALLRLGFIE